MGKNGTKKDVTFTQEMAEEVLLFELECAMKAITGDDSFTDEQKGKIRMRLEQLYLIGRDHGEKLSFAKALGEEQMNEITGIFNKIGDVITNGAASKEGAEKISRDTWMYARLFHLEHKLNELRKAQLDTIVEEFDLKTYGLLTKGCCCSSGPFYTTS